MTDKQNKNPPQSISTLMVTKVVIIDHDLTLDEHGEEQHREVPDVQTYIIQTWLIVPIIWQLIVLVVSHFYSALFIQLSV